MRRLRGAVLTHARGPVVVSAGALLLGIGAYVFLTLAARSLGVAAFGDLSTLWALLFGFVAGLWYPFEQVLTKLLAVTGGGRRSDVRRVAVIQAVMLGVIQLAVVIALLASSNTLLGHDPWLAGGLLISVASLAAASYQRGLLVGARRYGWAAAQQAFDGAARGIGAVVLAVVGADVGAYGVLLGLAPLVGVAAALAGTPAGTAPGLRVRGVACSTTCSPRATRPPRSGSSGMAMFVAHARTRASAYAHRSAGRCCASAVACRRRGEARRCAHQRSQTVSRPVATWPAPRMTCARPVSSCAERRSRTPRSTAARAANGVRGGEADRESPPAGVAVQPSAEPDLDVRTRSRAATAR